MPSRVARQRDTGETPTSGPVIATCGTYRTLGIAILIQSKDERSPMTHQWNKAAEQSHRKKISLHWSVNNQRSPSFPEMSFARNPPRRACSRPREAKAKTMTISSGAGASPNVTDIVS